MSEHTPGPWTVSPGPISDWWVEGPAWVYPTPGDCALEEADARLIAAAPDLLEALERAEVILERLRVWAATGEDSDSVLPEEVGEVLRFITALNDKARGSLTPE